MTYNSLHVPLHRHVPTCEAHLYNWDALALSSRRSNWLGNIPILSDRLGLPVFHDLSCHCSLLLSFVNGVGPPVVITAQTLVPNLITPAHMLS